MKRSIFVLTHLFLLSILGANAQSGEDFPYTEIPQYIYADGNAAAEWSALHFWDAYDFSATAKYTSQANKQGFLNFIKTLYATSPKHYSLAIEAMMQRAATSEEGYWYFLEMAEVMLYDPSSPLRNDLLWEMFLRHATGNNSPLDDVSKTRYVSLFQLVSRNQQGQKATDFTYTLADGSQGRLYDLKSPFVVLFFYNPGCSECARTKAQIEASGLLDALHDKGLVEVLAIHPDEDLTEWRQRLSEMPEWWITAYDKGQKIDQERLYDLKAIPTLYLLDGEKRVLMKDPVVEGFLGVLSRLLN